jgi:hypothetical protein
MRLVAFDRSEADDMPQRALASSRAEFSATDRERCLTALAEYAREWRKVGGPLVLAGGLAVAAHARNSIVAPALCLGCNALTRLLGSASAIVFATEEAANLYSKAGCFPLLSGQSPLGFLVDSFHRTRVLVMGADPYRVAAELEETVIELSRLLQDGVTQSEVACA